MRFYSTSISATPQCCWQRITLHLGWFLGSTTQTGAPGGITTDGGGANVYWSGNGSSLPGFWSDYTNFTTDPAGTIPLTGAISSSQDVVFSASGANNQTVGSNLLDYNATAHSLIINDPAGVGIMGLGGNTLTLTGSTGSMGITVGSGAGSIQAQIQAFLDLAGTPNITVNNSGGLAISGMISGTNGLIVNGSGMLTLTDLYVSQCLRRQRPVAQRHVERGRRRRRGLWRIEQPGRVQPRGGQQRDTAAELRRGELLHEFHDQQ